MAGWFKRRRSFDKSQLEKLFESYELPTFPTAVLDVLRLLRDDESTNAEVAHALEFDPGMSVRLIRVVNSAVFGLRQPVEDLGQAIQLIGRSSVESMLIAAAVGNTLPLDNKEAFDPAQFWRTAGLRAGVAGALAAEICRAERSLCWTAALLQDLAIPLLVDSIGEQYTDLLEVAAKGEQPLHRLERESFGWDHAEIGAAISESWALPESLTAAIAEHHCIEEAQNEPGDETDEELVTPIPVLVVSELEAGDDAPESDDLAAIAQARFGLDPEMLRKAIATGFEEAEQFAALVTS